MPLDYNQLFTWNETLDKVQLKTGVNKNQLADSIIARMKTSFCNVMFIASNVIDLCVSLIRNYMSFILAPGVVFSWI